MAQKVIQMPLYTLCMVEKMQIAPKSVLLGVSPIKIGSNPVYVTFLTDEAKGGSATLEEWYFLCVNDYTSVELGKYDIERYVGSTKGMDVSCMTSSSASVGGMNQIQITMPSYSLIDCGHTHVFKLSSENVKP